MTTAKKMSPDVRRKLDECGANVVVPSTRTGIGKRIAQVEELLRLHAEWGECPMDGTQDCCDTVVTELKLLNSYLGVVELYGEMCDRLRETAERHKLGLGGEQVDALVIEALDESRRLNGIAEGALIAAEHHLNRCGAGGALAWKLAHHALTELSGGESTVLSERAAPNEGQK